MATKTELLKKLTVDQLREIAVAEKIQIPRRSNKNEIIKCLLKLSMKRVRHYVTEYAEDETGKPREQPVPESTTDWEEEIADMTREYSRMGEAAIKLVKERLKGVRLPELVKEELKKATHARESILENELPYLRARYLPEISENKLKARVKEEPEPIEEISEVLPDRITTGHEDLDSLLLGGIPKNYAVILTSGSFDERELLIRGFLEAGVKEGQITFHVTIEASNVRTLAEEFQSNFFLFICNPQADAIIKTLPNVFKIKGVDNLNEINIALTSAFRKLDASQKRPRRACIEIISDVLLQHHAPSIRKWLAALIPELKSRGFTILAVVNPLMHPSEEVQAIQDLFDGEISIFQKETRRGSQKYLKITKLYNQRYLENELPLRKS
ncbi:MAG: ATPase domain-containing protein [Candidatus Bathyarchaeota archaeon]|jgi:KaiC/GvpD/RAD55 family RecA-like ATPase